MISAPVASCLADLIGFDTRNPLGDEGALCHHLGEILRARGADSVDVRTVSRPGMRDGAYVYARFGTPTLLLNAHVDTVPANTGWVRDPLTAEITADRVYGLGACDTKAAIAAIVTGLDTTGPPRDVGILFSGDEEAGSLVMRAFLADADNWHGLTRAIVCEPTARRAGVRHRGISAYHAHVRGCGGHSSRADDMPKPIVTMAKLAVALDKLGADHRQDGSELMRGTCMNVAALEGGVAVNVVPDSASLSWSIRPPPGFDSERFVRETRQAIAGIDPAIEVDTTLDHPPFASSDAEALRQVCGDFVTESVSLDFWTEAALLERVGVAAVVLGPGDIAQAHAADEFVSLADLAWAQALFEHVLSASRA